MAVGHLVPRQGQNGHRPDRQGQVEQVDGHAEARQQQRDAGGGDAPGTGEEQRQGVMQGAEDERRDGQDEPEQRGRQPRVQEEGGREEGRGLQGDRDKSGGDGLLVSTNFRIGFLASLEKKRENGSKSSSWEPLDEKPKLLESNYLTRISTQSIIGHLRLSKP